MRVSHPIAVQLPSYGVLFAESFHASDFQMPERRDGFHKIIYVLQGTVTLLDLQRAQTTVAETGSLLLIPAEARHAMVDEKASTLLLLCLAPKFVDHDSDLRELWRELVRRGTNILYVSRSSRKAFDDLWRKALAQKLDRRKGSALNIRTFAAQILVQLARIQVSPHNETAAQRVSEVIAEVASSFYDEWNVDRAAQRAGLSRRRFTAIFRETCGQTFHSYLEAQRLTRAALLLRTREHSIMGVIFSCGFNDVSHFYRLFRRRYGRTPREWRNTRSLAPTALEDL